MRATAKPSVQTFVVEHSAPLGFDGAEVDERQDRRLYETKTAELQIVDYEGSCDLESAIQEVLTR